MCIVHNLIWYIIMSACYTYMCIVHNLIWYINMFTAVESYLSANKEGNLGVTGEGTLLDHAQGIFYTC